MTVSGLSGFSPGISNTVKDVEKIIGYPIWAKMPNDYKVAVNALNRGVSFVSGVPSSKISQSIFVMADLLLNGKTDNKDEKTKKKKGFFGKR